MKCYKEIKTKYYPKVTWTQPTLTTNGTMGGSSFAVSTTCEVNVSSAWKAFDGSTSTYGYCYFNAPNNNKGDYILYNPKPINITQLTINLYIVTQVTVYYSDDGKTFTQCGYLSRGSTWGQATVVVNVDTGNTFHKYYKIYFNNTAGVSQPQIYDIKITAVEEAYEEEKITYKLPTKVLGQDKLTYYGIGD